MQEQTSSDDGDESGSIKNRWESLQSNNDNEQDEDDEDD